MINPSGTTSNQLINLLVKANQFRKKREYKQALGIYEDIIRLCGETVDFDQVIAYCYFQLGLSERDETKYLIAVTWAKKAIELAPTNSQSYDILGEVQSLGTLEYQEAAQAFRRSIELDPNNLHALVGGAALYGVPEDVVKLNEAIGWLEQVVQIEPNNPNYHLNLGMLYYEDSQITKAEGELSKALVCPRPLEVSANRAISKIIGIDL